MVEYYILETADGWLFKQPGFIQPITRFKSRKEALEYVRRLEKQGEIFVRLQDMTGHWQTVTSDGDN